MKFTIPFICMAMLYCQRATASDSTIYRKIDLSQTFRDFPVLVGYLNSSLQKAPAPVISELAEDMYGKPEMVRCWLNLDEMWDYRTRDFNFNYQIGIDKYKAIPEKSRETWNWEQPSDIRFYDYLQSFSQHSKEIMLTIRRYERDILDKTLPVSLADWKMIFKTGLKHYKARYPNIRYVEVANEYETKGFMRATDDEYYRFYQMGYEAVNEVNAELGLKGTARILVGGPVSVSNFLERIDQFTNLFAQDTDPAKRLDFVSWHEYTRPYIETVFHERTVRDILKRKGLKDNIPLFISEHDPWHLDKDSPERHFLNTAGLVKSLYFASLYSPNMHIFPWVLYHNADLQTRFMWFTGPNRPDTRKDEIKMLPTGISMKILSMHAGKEVWVDNQLTGNDLVIASSKKGSVLVEAVNYGNPKPVRIELGQLANSLGTGKVYIRKYLIDKGHNNVLTNPGYPGRLQVAEEQKLELAGKSVQVLEHAQLDKDAIVAWEISVGQ